MCRNDFYVVLERVRRKWSQSLIMPHEQSEFVFVIGGARNQQNGRAELMNYCTDNR